MDTTSLLEPEFEPHFTAWQSSPSPETASRLLQATQPVLDSALRSYGGPTASPVLRSRAKLMTLDALKTYDPSRAKLRTHLMVQLQGLRRQAAREQQVISVPERVAIDLYHLHAAENELRDRLSRDPSDLELAEHSGMSLKRLEHVRRARPGYAEGTVQAVTATDEDQGGFAPSVQSRNDDAAWINFVYHDLDSIDQVIMEHVLGLRGKPVLPKQEIARRLGVSPAAVSQRAARIQEKLDQREAAGLI